MSNTLKYKENTDLGFLFFDALSVTVKTGDNKNEILDLLKSFSEETQMYPVKERSGNAAYSHTIEFENDDGIVMVSYGGAVAGMGVLFETKGMATSSLLADFINWIDSHHWSLTRADVTLDFKGDDAVFDKVREDLLNHSRRKNVRSFNRAGDWDTLGAGRTQYAGSKDSESRFRLYEKTYEQWNKGNTAFPAEVLRLEWQYRPKRKKAYINRLEPCFVLSHSKNALAFFSTISALGIEPTKVPKKKPKTDLDVFYHMIDQYNGVIGRLVGEHGIFGVVRMAFSRFKMLQGSPKPDTQ